MANFKQATNADQSIAIGEKPQAKMSWRDEEGKRPVPMFYRRINDRLKRVSLKEGLKMVEEGILPMTEQLKEFISNSKK